MATRQIVQATSPQYVIMTLKTPKCIIKKPDPNQGNTQLTKSYHKDKEINAFYVQ